MSNLVEEIRKQIDSLDNQVHDLLMKRTELVMRIGKVKRESNITTVQPAREAIMLRRLMNRHEGPLPKEAVVRIWRELVGAVSLLQTGLKVVVTVPEDKELEHWDMAKDYFSSVLPMQKIGDSLGAIGAIREGDTTFGVVPWPVDGEQSPWWMSLMEEDGEIPMRIVARLPFGNRKQGIEDPEHQALVVARVDYNSSGDDRSFLALALDPGVSRARIVEKAKELKLKPRNIYSHNLPQTDLTKYFMEVEVYVAPGDKKLSQLLEHLDMPDGLCVCLGGYPVPPVYDDKVGKGSIEEEKAENAAKQTA